MQVVTRLAPAWAPHGPRKQRQFGSSESTRPRGAESSRVVSASISSPQPFQTWIEQPRHCVIWCGSSRVGILAVLPGEALPFQNLIPLHRKWLGVGKHPLHSLGSSMRPSLLGWRPSLLGWRPWLLGLGKHPFLWLGHVGTGFPGSTPPPQSPRPGRLACPQREPRAAVRLGASDAQDCVHGTSRDTPRGVV